MYTRQCTGAAITVPSSSVMVDMLRTVYCTSIYVTEYKVFILLKIKTSEENCVIKQADDKQTTNWIITKGCHRGDDPFVFRLPVMLMETRVCRDKQLSKILKLMVEADKGYTDSRRLSAPNADYSYAGQTG